MMEDNVQMPVYHQHKDFQQHRKLVKERRCPPYKRIRISRRGPWATPHLAWTNWILKFLLVMNIWLLS